MFRQTVLEIMETVFTPNHNDIPICESGPAKHSYDLSLRFLKEKVHSCLYKRCLRGRRSTAPRLVVLERAEETWGGSLSRPMIELVTECSLGIAIFECLWKHIFFPVPLERSSVSAISVT